MFLSAECKRALIRDEKNVLAVLSKVSERTVAIIRRNHGILLQ